MRSETKLNERERDRREEIGGRERERGGREKMNKEWNINRFASD